MSWVSGGQLVVIQTGVLSPGQPAGRPLIITIFSTPSSFARRKVFSVTSQSFFLLEGKGVAGAVQGAQGDIPAAKLVHPALPGRFGAEQFVQVDVGRAGPVAGADLHGLNALRHAEIQHGRKGHIQCAGFDRKPHRGPPWSLIFLGAAAGRRMKIVFFRGELRGAIPW